MEKSEKLRNQSTFAALDHDAIVTKGKFWK